VNCRCAAHHCTDPATPTGLCEACQLGYELGGNCGLPYVPSPTPPPLPPEVVLKEQDVTAAIDNAAEEQLGI
jgi:hypothetical protein